MKKTEVALYVRVSTKDKQEEQNQIDDLTLYCKKSELTIVKVYADRMSGSTSARESFQEMLLDAHKKKFDMVLFWALDRFSREGVLDTLKHLSELDTAGVSYRSYNEPFISSYGPFKELSVAFFAIMAKQERILISERVKSGMRRAKKEGKRISRPPLNDAHVKKIKELLKNGLSIYRVSKILNISPSTVKKYKGAI